MSGNQGRESIPLELRNLFPSYFQGKNVWFVLEGEKSFRLVLEDETSEDMNLVSLVKIDDKGRLVIPKEIRRLYNGPALFCGRMDCGHIFVHFLDAQKSDM